MKKFLSKALVCLLLISLSVSGVALCLPVSAYSDISTMSYENNSFSFKGSCHISYHCTGMFLNVSVRATASNNNNETITLKVYITNRDATKTYTFYSDGQTHEFKNIYLGLSGGSNVVFSFYGANPEITINTNLEIRS